MISSLEYFWRFFRAWLAQKGSLRPCPRNEEKANDNVLDVAEWLGGFAVLRVRFVRGTARYRTWREVERRPNDGASRFPQREIEEVIMVEGLIEEMYGSD